VIPIYLSAGNPRWTPGNEADVQAGIDRGLLGESHYLDLKQVPATRGDNKEAARDLVSFAVDGGTLIYGIAEDKANRTFALAPQPLNGLAEKMEQIALSSLVDPVLTVACEEIPSDADPAGGYLVIHIPASPVAPHMADGRYYGRNDKTKYVLSDPEVFRLHERRRAADRDALMLLEAEIGNDRSPLTSGSRLTCSSSHNHWPAAGTCSLT
jgi:predicted HTH transcriptional regulator